MDRWQFAADFDDRIKARTAARNIMAANPDKIARYRADLIESFGGPVGRWVVEVQPV